MKKTVSARLLVILVSALFVLSLPGTVLAHNPDRMEVAYDAKAQTLSVKITHPSNNPDRHYVKEVVVKKNGQVVARGEYTKQPGDTFVYTFQVAATGADTFEITAVCNIRGSITAKYSPGV
jgi:desulfoferrodoxin (superoxide reductase-like protein)